MPIFNLEVVKWTIACLTEYKAGTPIKYLNLKLCWLNEPQLFSNCIGKEKGHTQKPSAAKKLKTYGIETKHAEFAQDSRATCRLGCTQEVPAAHRTICCTQGYWEARTLVGRAGSPTR